MVDRLRRHPLLACGLVAPVIYIGADIVAALITPGYHYTAQAVSELSAIGAPTRSFVVAAGFVFVVLLIAFAAGVWRSARAERAVRVSAAMLAGWGLVNLPGAFFSMRLRGEGSLAVDAGHLILTALTVVFIVLAVGFGAGAGGRRFRMYSIATVVAVLAFGALASTQAPAVAAGQPTPWLGLIERVSVYAPVVWLAVLAVVRLRADRLDGTVAEDGSIASSPPTRPS